MTEQSLRAIDDIMALVAAGRLDEAARACLRGLELGGLDHASIAWFEARFDEVESLMARSVLAGAIA